MGNPYDLLVKQDAHLTEWKNISTHPDIGHLSGSIDRKNTVTVNASGSVSAGQIVAFNDDGTVTAAYKNPDIVGEKDLITPDNISYSDIVYHPVADRVVAFYSDFDGGHAVVGTISGDRVSWGTPVVFNTDNTYFIQALYDPITDRIVIAFGDLPSTLLTGQTCSLSGDTLTFGTAVRVSPNEYYHHAKMVYDSINNQFIISYQTAEGTWEGVCRICNTTLGASPSADTFTFGPAIPFITTTISDVDVVYNKSIEKIIIVFRETLEQGGQIGSSIVGSISGSNITFGQKTQFQEIYTPTSIKLSYDPTHDKYIVFWLLSSPNRCYYSIGAVINDSVEWGNGILFSNNAYPRGVTYSPDSENILFFYSYDVSGKYASLSINGDTANINYSSVFHSVGTISRVSLEFDPANRIIILFEDSTVGDTYTRILTEGLSNLLQDNFLGIAQNDALHGQPVLVGTLGWMDEQQSNLTIPSKYYSDAEGNVKTFGNVEIGKSSSDTDLIITR